MNPYGKRHDVQLTSTSDAPTLYTERLALTIPGEPAAEARVRFNHENQAHLAPWNPTMTGRDFDVRFWREALERFKAQAAQGTRYSFCIFERDRGLDGSLLGYVNFTEIVRGVFQACYMGYALSESAQGKGYMRLHRIMANYMPNNARSAALLQRLGFSIEGSARN